MNDYNPETNADAISLIKQKDGNWKGWKQVNGKLVEVRDIAPDIVLGRLLTHDGR